MQDYSNEDFINHKCVVMIDPKGKTILNATPQPYDLMDSGTKKKQPKFTYLGFGTAHSCFSTKLGREVSISGSGHFYKLKKKP